MMTSSSFLWNFLDISNKWINLRFGIDEIKTSWLMSYTFGLEIAIIPLLGYLGDEYGLRTS